MMRSRLYRFSVLSYWAAIIAILFAVPVFAQGDFCQQRPDHPHCGGGNGGNDPCDPAVYDSRWQVIDSVDDFVPVLTGQPDTITCAYITPGAYRVTDTITINRSTPLYIHGGDKTATRLIVDQPVDEARTLFLVERAPLLNIANLKLQPTGPTWYPVGSRSIVFDGTGGEQFQVELLDAMVDRGEILIQGAGSYRLQNVDFSNQGMNESLLIVDHPDADVLVVGGNMGGGSQPVSIEYCDAPQGVCVDSAAACNTDTECGFGFVCVGKPEVPDPSVLDPSKKWGRCASGLPPACSSDADCTQDEILERCVGTDPNTCRTFHAVQRAGRLRIIGTGMQVHRGPADIRIDSAAPGNQAHVVAAVRTEGRKCANALPSTLVSVTPSTDAVDLVVMNNEGGWVNEGVCMGLGHARFLDYNARGTVWMIGNNSNYGARALAEGQPGGGNLIALGNRFFANIGEGRCLVSGDACETHQDCPPAVPDQCVFPDPRDVSVGGWSTVLDEGNLYSRQEYCNWCESNSCVPSDACADCTAGNCPNSEHRDVDFTDYPVGQSLTTLSLDATPVPVLDIPSALRRPDPVDLMSFSPVDSADCLLPGPCAGFYPDYCAASLRCDESRTPCVKRSDCPPGQACTSMYDDRCGLQATLNKAMTDKQPAYIRENSFVIDKPLYFVHSEQELEGGATIPSPPGGGWIVGQNNNVTIRFERSGMYCDNDGQPCADSSVCSGGECGYPPQTVFETEGMAYGVVQGIRFESDPYVGGTCSGVGGRTCFSDQDCRVCEEQGAGSGAVCSGGSETTCNFSVDCLALTCNAPPGDPTVALENVAGVGSSQQQTVFHDCEFRGGRDALAISLRSPTMCDTNMIVGSTFADAGIGFSSTGANALHNVIYDVTFENNLITMGNNPYATVPPPGSWVVLHATVTGTAIKDIELQGGGRVLFSHDLQSATPKIIEEQTNTGWGASLVFDQSDLAGAAAAGDVCWRYSHSNGASFLYSTVHQGELLLEPSLAVKYLLNLSSDIDAWDFSAVPPLPDVDAADGTRAYEWPDPGAP